MGGVLEFVVFGARVSLDRLRQAHGVKRTAVVIVGKAPLERGRDISSALTGVQRSGNRYSAGDLSCGPRLAFRRVKEPLDAERMLTMADVLLVDDDEMAREIVKRMLLRAGHDVREASDGAEALNSLDRGGAAPDCIVLDLMMPGVGGLEVLRRVREDARFRDVPVVLMTALSEGAEVEQARACGFGRHFVKAYWHVGELLQAIAHLAGGASRRAAVAVAAN
jgi:CheY-like chemotaxis protein